MVEIYLKTIDGRERTIIGDIIINKDSVQYIREDGSGDTIYKQYISKLRINDYMEPVENLGEEIHIGKPWEMLSAPRYNECKGGEKP